MTFAIADLVNRTEYDTFNAYPTQITPASWCEIVWEVILPVQVRRTFC